ncbi:hypothetical protein [Pseudomonas piscis]
MADAYGLRVRNKDKILQIDGDYQCQELVSVSTLTMSSRDDFLPGYHADLTVPSGRENTTIAVSGSSQGVYVKKISPTVFRIYSGNSSDGTRTVKVYVFADPLNNEVGGVGLVVRSRTTGGIVYNSNKRYARILGFVPVSVNVYQAYSGSYPGKSIAIIQSVRPYAIQTTAYAQEFFSGVMRNNGESAYIIEHRHVARAPGQGSRENLYESPQGTYIIVDVTDY